MFFPVRDDTFEVERCLKKFLIRNVHAIEKDLRCIDEDVATEGSFAIPLLCVNSSGRIIMIDLVREGDIKESVFRSLFNLSWLFGHSKDMENRYHRFGVKGELEPSAIYFILRGSEELFSIISFLNAKAYSCTYLEKGGEKGYFIENAFQSSYQQSFRRASSISRNRFAPIHGSNIDLTREELLEFLRI